MITNKGALIIKGFMGKQLSNIGDTLVLGAGSTQALATDTRLNYEFARTDVSLVSYDFTNNQIVFKGTINQDVAGTISEVGLLATNAQPVISTSSRSLANFTSSNNFWTNANFSSLNTFVDYESLVITGTTNNSVTAVLPSLQLDLANYSGVDSFVFAYYSANSNCNSIKFRFSTDDSNYFEFTQANPTANALNMPIFTKSSATITGSPDWSVITSFKIIVGSGSGGAASIYAQGARIERAVNPADSGGLVARSVLSTPIKKLPVNVQDFEYRIGVTFQ